MLYEPVAASAAVGGVKELGTDVSIETAAARLARVRASRHRGCVVCDPVSLLGLKVAYRALDDGSVVADVACSELLRGYAGRLHGGVICCLLDGAMCNCLFARGVAGVTAELAVRFQQPVVTGRPATVRARHVQEFGPLHTLEAEVLQGGTTVATATGKFWDLSASDGEPRTPEA